MDDQVSLGLSTMFDLALMDRAPYIGRMDVPSVASRKGKLTRPKTLRPIGPSMAAELELSRFATKLFAEGAKLTRVHGLPEAASLKAQLATLDTAEGVGLFVNALRRFLEASIGGSEGLIRDIFTREERRHRSSLESAVQAAVGIDLSSVLEADDVEAHIDLATQQSVLNIRGISDDLVKKVQTSIITGAKNGDRSTDIAKQLSEDFGWSNKRAKLIARDQVATFNGALNKVRQQQAGFDRYIWSTSMDERVRPAHEAREGQIFSWDDPPEDGHPGEPINCRCVALALIEPPEDADQVTPEE
jgi:SPP1 gp7 family putative phage head morphogenesis protein